MEKNKKSILDKWQFIILLGESGGGKGTLVKKIKKHWLPDITSASMGDIFREKSNTDPEIKRLVDEGTLINDDIVSELFRDFAKNASPGLMDGFPRNRQQTLDVVKFIKEMGWRVLVIDLKCDLEVIIERLLARGRADDKLAIMYKRNADHKTLHPSVMEEIKCRPDLFDIIHLNGNQGVDLVFTSFLLDVLRLVDMLYLYDFNNPVTMLSVDKNETTIDPTINRWLCQLLASLQDRVDELNQ